MTRNREDKKLFVDQWFHLHYRVYSCHSQSSAQAYDENAEHEARMIHAVTDKNEV